jgi:hypothetical protein
MMPHAAARRAAGMPFIRNLEAARLLETEMPRTPSDAHRFFAFFVTSHRYPSSLVDVIEAVNPHAAKTNKQWC